MAVTRALRTLHLVEGGRPGGGGRQTLALAAGLAAKGHRPGLVTTGSLLNDVTPARVEILSLPARGPARWIALRRAVTSGGWDILHAHDPAMAGSLRWVCAGASRPPLVLSVGGDVVYGRGAARGIGGPRGVAR